MEDKYSKKKAIEHYKLLESYANKRKEDTNKFASDYIILTDNYGELVSRLTLMLGYRKPKDTQDIVIRDLLADVFDFLYESRALIVSGKLNISFPVARRAYESLSLLHLFTLDNLLANKWHNGKKINNEEVRKKLSTYKLGESEAELKKLYKFFCTATHPNRELIAQRFLGEDNFYVLGTIGIPDIILVFDYMIKNIEMWFWFLSVITFFYKELILENDSDYFKFYMDISKKSVEIKSNILNMLNNLSKE